MHLESPKEQTVTVAGTRSRSPRARRSTPRIPTSTRSAVLPRTGVSPPRWRPVATWTDEQGNDYLDARVEDVRCRLGSGRAREGRIHSETFRISPLVLNSGLADRVRAPNTACPSAKPTPGACSTSRTSPVRRTSRSRPRTPIAGPGTWRRWVYDKVAVALYAGARRRAAWRSSRQSYPVFSKPITNLKGMGVGSRVLHTGRRLHRALRARPHVDDAARRPPCVVGRGGGERQAEVVASCDRQAERRGGTFDYWTMHAAGRRRTSNSNAGHVDRGSGLPATPAW